MPNAFIAALPHVNAGLNTATFLLIVLGLVAIKRKRESLHIKLMLSAVATSVLFLISYLTLHFAIGTTRFTGDGTIRTVYFAILFSHTILAGVQVPLIITTVVLGLRDRRSQHRRWAKVTAPIWMYVSITGVAIYYMLYHL